MGQGSRSLQPPAGLDDGSRPRVKAERVTHGSGQRGCPRGGGPRCALNAERDVLHKPRSRRGGTSAAAQGEGKVPAASHLVPASPHSPTGQSGASPASASPGKLGCPLRKGGDAPLPFTGTGGARRGAASSGQVPVPLPLPCPIERELSHSPASRMGPHPGSVLLFTVTLFCAFTPPRPLLAQFSCHWYCGHPPARPRPSPGFWSKGTGGQRCYWFVSFLTKSAPKLHSSFTPNTELLLITFSLITASGEKRAVKARNP